MSDQCTSHGFCCINICASSCGPLKRSPLEKKYNVCKNYDAKNKNKWILRKINAYVNIKTDSLQDLIWIHAWNWIWSIMKTFKPCTCTTEKEKRSDEFAKGNKKEQMLLLAAEIQPYAHTNFTNKHCLVHTELQWLCIFASTEQILLTKNNFMLYQGLIYCYISQVVTYSYLYSLILMNIRERLNI